MLPQTIFLRISERNQENWLNNYRILLQNGLQENQWEVNYRKETCRESYRWLDITFSDRSKGSPRLSSGTIWHRTQGPHELEWRKNSRWQSWIRIPSQYGLEEKDWSIGGYFRNETQTQSIGRHYFQSEKASQCIDDIFFKKNSHLLSNHFKDKIAVWVIIAVWYIQCRMK